MTLSFMRNHAVSATEKSESKTEPRVETHRAVTFKGGELREFSKVQPKLYSSQEGPREVRLRLCPLPKQ